MIPAERFFAVDEDLPPQQGDILLAGVARLVAEDRFTPPAWVSLDQNTVTVEPGGNARTIRLDTGPALVMVTSHDCHFDKDWNAVRQRLINQGVAEDEATRRVNNDQTLDRPFTASPLIPPGDVPRNIDAVMSGSVIGYLPVPAYRDVILEAAVVDLSYRVTLDRSDIVRVASISAEARAQLRYAMARLEILRTVIPQEQVERAVGMRITDVAFAGPFAVRLQLEDGSSMELILPPTEAEDAGPAREAPVGLQ